MKPEKESTEFAVKNARARWHALLGTGVPDERSFLLLTQGCKTQNEFAKLDIPAFDIEPLALNTLKAAADIDVVPGGWEELDQKRKQLWKKNRSLVPCKAKQRRNASSQLELTKEKNRDLERRESESRKFRGVIVRGYQAMLDTLRTLSATNPTVYETLRKHEATYDIRIMYPIDVGMDGNDGSKKK